MVLGLDTLERLHPVAPYGTSRHLLGTLLAPCGTDGALYRHRTKLRHRTGTAVYSVQCRYGAGTYCTVPAWYQTPTIFYYGDVNAAIGTCLVLKKNNWTPGRLSTSANPWPMT